MDVDAAVLALRFVAKTVMATWLLQGVQSCTALVTVLSPRRCFPRISKDYLSPCRAIPDPAEEDSVISRPLFSLSNLQQLDIWGEHGIHTVFKLKWLSGLPRLEHLTAFITQPTQVCNNCPAAISIQHSTV